MKSMQSWLERISSRIVLKRSLTSLADVVPLASKPKNMPP